MALERVEWESWVSQTNPVNPLRGLLAELPRAEHDGIANSIIAAAVEKIRLSQEALPFHL